MIYVYSFTACFDGKIGVFQQTVVRVYYISLGKVVATTLLPPIPLSHLRGWDADFECGFSIKISDSFLMS